MKLVLLNGPPRSGKDFAMRALRTHFSPRLTFRHDKFSMPIKLAFAALMQHHIDPDGNVDYYEANKGEKMSTLGISYRQWQIDFSEKFMKPLYGPDIFAHLFLDRQELRKTAADYLCVVSDCGFQTECEAVLRNWNTNDVLLIRIFRQDCTFAGDSRETVRRRDGGPEVEITNDGTTNYAFIVTNTAEKFLGQN